LVDEVTFHRGPWTADGKSAIRVTKLCFAIIAPIRQTGDFPEDYAAVDNIDDIVD